MGVGGSGGSRGVDTGICVPDLGGIATIAIG